MRKVLLALLLCGSFGLADAATAQQCVPYARQNSNIALKGDAWMWWAAAEGAYERGSQPKPGAVLVFKKTASMRYGHVAVVSRVVGKREIRIDHANWERGAGRGKVTRDVAVLDVSPANDWTQVRVWHGPSNTFGVRINPTYGFIYDRNGRRSTLSVAYERPADPAPAETRRSDARRRAQPPATETRRAESRRPTGTVTVPVPSAKPAYGVNRARVLPVSSNAEDLNRQVLERFRTSRGG